MELHLVPLRLAVLAKRLIARFGLRPDVFVLPLAVVIGVATSILAVVFHELIRFIRDQLYLRSGPELLYGRGLALLIAIPAAGGLVVGLVSRYVLRAKEGHGVVDVMESVIRSRGFVKPLSAVEKILTSAVTIGTGGSAGAEGPIVQIGAAVSSAVGNLLSLDRRHMPLLIGCGSAAGISSIFHSPIGGVLFTLEVILRDFSIRTFGPVVVASVVANITTQWSFSSMGLEGYHALFVAAPFQQLTDLALSWTHAGVFLGLGILCGLVGVSLTMMMRASERAFAPLQRLGPIKPAIGGALLGVLGMVYILFFGWMLNTPKPIPFDQYPMPAFFGDGYGVIHSMLTGSFGAATNSGSIVLLLSVLIAFKLIGTCVTLSSGGSGGVIAPSIFLGAALGSLTGSLLHAGSVSVVPTRVLALVGMGGVLVAVVHSPLASILILFELTQDPGVVVPAMLVTVTATGIARLIFSDSVYTMSLHRRGLRPGGAVDQSFLRQLTVERVSLDSIIRVRPNDTIEHLIEVAMQTKADNFLVVDEGGHMVGMIVGEDLKVASISRETGMLVTAADVMRQSVPALTTLDDLATAMDLFTEANLESIPVRLASHSGAVIGFLSRDTLMRLYQKRIFDASE